MSLFNRLDGRTVNKLASCAGGLEFKFWIGKIGIANGNGSPTRQHHSTQPAVLPWRYDAEMGTANSLHASA